MQQRSKGSTWLAGNAPSAISIRWSTSVWNASVQSRWRSVSARTLGTWHVAQNHLTRQILVFFSGATHLHRFSPVSLSLCACVCVCACANACVCVWRHFGHIMRWQRTARRYAQSPCRRALRVTPTSKFPTPPAKLFYILLYYYRYTCICSPQTTTFRFAIIALPPVLLHCTRTNTPYYIVLYWTILYHVLSALRRRSYARWCTEIVKLTQELLPRN